jgi:hypothetical protein
VEQKSREVAYLLKLPATWKGIYPVINEGWLLPYTVPTSPLQKQPSPPPVVIVEGEEEYKVVMIHGKKRSRNQDLYLMEWVGYPNKVDWTWKPQTNLTNADEMLMAFKKRTNKSTRMLIRPHTFYAHNHTILQLSTTAPASRYRQYTSNQPPIKQSTCDHAISLQSINTFNSNWYNSSNRLHSSSRSSPISHSHADWVLYHHNHV